MRLLAAVTAVCLAGISIAAATPKAEDIVKTVKIMPLGDSITGSPVGMASSTPSDVYRIWLLARSAMEKAPDANITKTDFVGSTGT
ncbi:hypothetical protein RJ035_002621 [Blastomyces gilchristii]